MVMQIRKTENVFIQGVMKRKMQENNKDKVEARFAERKQKINSLNIKC